MNTLSVVNRAGALLLFLGTSSWAAFPCSPIQPSNPGFEILDQSSNPTNWTYVSSKAGAQGITTIPANVYSGLQAVELSNTDGSTGSWRGMVSDLIPVTPEMEYVLSAHVRSLKGTELVYIGWQEYDVNQLPLTMNYFVLYRSPVTKTWAAYQGSQWTSANARFVKIRLFGPYESTGTVWWDAVSLRPENLLRNASFEEGSSPAGMAQDWFHYSGSDASKQVTQNQSTCGTSSWQMELPSTPNPGNIYMGIRSDFIPVDPQSDYFLSADVKSLTGKELCYAGWKEFDANHQPVHASPVYFILDHQTVPSTAWTTYQRMQKPHPDTRFVQIILIGPSKAAGTVWWDNISFKKSSRLTLDRRIQNKNQPTRATLRLSLPDAIRTQAELHIRVIHTQTQNAAFSTTILSPDARLQIEIPGLAEGPYSVSAELKTPVKAEPVWRDQSTLSVFAPRPQNFTNGNFKTFGVPSVLRFIYDSYDTADFANALEAIKSQGFNAVEVPKSKLTPAYMQKAAALGLKVIIFTGLTTNAELPALIGQYKNDPALLAWYTLDEPSTAWQDNFLESYSIFRSEDPVHPVLTSFNDPQGLRELADGIDIAMSDPYPVPYTPLTLVSDFTDQTVNAVRSFEKPVFTTLQAFGEGALGQWPNWTRAPTPQESRAMTYLALIHGSTGLGYYSFARSKLVVNPNNPNQTIGIPLPIAHPALWESFRTLNQELDALSPILHDGSLSNAIVSDSVNIHHQIRSYEGKLYLIAVNTMNNAEQVSFTLTTPMTITHIQEMFTQQSLPIKPAHTFSDSLEAYGVRVYELSGPPDGSVVVNDFREMRTYPNPWRANQHAGQSITFDQLTLHSSIKIYTLAGHWIRTLDAPNGSVTWDMKNESGELVASGLYLYLVTNGQGQTAKGKLAIIK